MSRVSIIVARFLVMGYPYYRLLFKGHPVLCISVGSSYVGIVVRSEDHVVTLQATTGLLLCQANGTYKDRIRIDKIGQNKVLNPPREDTRGERDRLFDEAQEAFSSESWLDTRSKPSVRHPIQQWLCGKHHLS